ncbi:hypothetical protein EYF80_044697 [Liparis tanakae]|uniref:Uncharacterized protein n=1 Tax=Liparis tanakae TaxID=230148 RepID=A0A4Z2FW53_9TELE|nr:hypothetical protein EYF80_044697 [Liparis tanakae]
MESPVDHLTMPPRLMYSGSGARHSAPSISGCLRPVSRAYSSYSYSPLLVTPYSRMPGPPGVTSHDPCHFDEYEAFEVCAEQPRAARLSSGVMERMGGV